MNVPFARHLFVSALLISVPTSARGATYQVPSVTHPTMQTLVSLLVPGDIVEVQGNATYPGGLWFQAHGTPSAPITIRGIKVNGNRPRLHGGANVVQLDGDNYLFEGFEVTGITSPVTNRGIYCKSNNITIRDCIVHDCPKQGILGADTDSGSVTIEHTEVYACGGGTFDHQLYMATDNDAFPSAVVRIQFCYIHDANGGNSIKSRAGRNEIYYNWVEGAQHHELELIGADPAGGVSANIREDSDVVGNVLRKKPTSTGALARIGGDGTGDSNGRFRFVNNTMLMGGAGSAAIRLQQHVQSLEMFNNGIWRADGGAMNVVRTTELEGTATYSGATNWVQTGSTGIPSAWTGTLTGTDPGFENIGTYNLTPLETSPLRNVGTLPTFSPAGFLFISPLAAPGYLPPVRALVLPGSQMVRSGAGVVDIGAIEGGNASGVGGWNTYP